MKCGKRILKPEEYEAIKNFSYKELNNWMRNNLGDSIVYGYGYYGCSSIRDGEDGEHYIEYRMGDTCD